MNFKGTLEFQKDFKRLLKKFKSLDADLVEFKKILSESPLGIGKHFNVITKVGNVSIIKARFFCKSLKKKDLRVIYAFIENHQIVEMNGAEFIEIYFKGEKENEDKSRIKAYLENH
ncbi:MAG: hypothetical protein NTV62_02775 [Candidatus Gribaldobacteria bacterium]|nr:hypothetical protein [Candidatus Gribaldobacteria bacterium]